MTMQDLSTQNNNTLKYILTTGLCALALMSQPATADPNSINDKVVEPSIESAVTQPPSPLLLSHANFLNEISTRRQVNTFFPNEQSVFYGTPVNFVNTSRGTLTFTRRDMVLVGRNPIVMARVYDSSLTGGDDFGQGWQLSYAQTIAVQADGSLQYRDGSASLPT